jgi:hypothetical protein
MGGCKLSNSNSDHRGKNANDAASGAEIGAATGTAVAAAGAAASPGAAANADATASIAASAGISASLAQTYTNLIWDLRLLQWSNYFEGGVHDLSLLDSQFFMLAKQFLSRYASAFTPTDRQSEIVRTLLSRDLVDKNPAAAKLRNRLDDWNNYRDDDSASASSATSSTTDRRLALARKMRSDVLDLMYIRNGLAKDQGYHSYPDLVLATEELNRERLIKMLHDFLDANLPHAQHLIKKYDIHWESWFSDLNRIAPLAESFPGTSAPAPSPAFPFDPSTAINRFLELLGLTDARSKIKIAFQDHGFAGMTSEVAPGDIRVMVEPIASLAGFKVLFHELGHALTYCFNQEQDLFRILPASYDEAMAVVIEYFAPRLLLGPTLQKKAAEIDVLEHTRCAISALFELELWESPAPKQPEELYLKHYGRLGVQIDHPELWALDSFRSIDPVYIHNYVIGAVLAPRLYDFLLQSFGDDYHSWGRWLINNVYFDGRKRPFSEKVASIYTI